MTRADLSREGRSPLVHLMTVPDAFHARVVAARLGADGVVTELRGGTGGIYPFGQVTVWVRTDDEEVARELLLADQVEDAFDRPYADQMYLDRRARLATWSRRRVLAAAALVAVVAGATGGRLAH